jgi:Carboxypeptidase regulatory-like domain/TonB-dependent Receptor Plug Domain
MRNHIWAIFRAWGLTCALAFVAASLFAQTATTGSINGLVTDPTGAAVPGAMITVRDTGNGATINLVSNAEGRFTAPFLKPDAYNLTASAPGLQSSSTKVQVLTGQQSAVNIVVSPEAAAQTVEVSANNAQLIDTQSSNFTTTFTTEQFRDLPTPGGDITTIAYTVPGVVMGAGTQGFGAIVSDGLPGLSNVVTINGVAYNLSLYGGVNFSGSSNLTIGQQEIAQASVVQDGYSVQYGRQAGIIETYVTKAGSNRVHGLLQWQYNSDGLNANDFFNNQSGIPRPKAVSNQYAAQIGGPILRDRLFFFADTEGIRYIQPSTGFVNLPSPALQASVLANPGITADSKALYAAMFAGANASPAYKNAVPVVTGNGAQQDASGNYGCGSLGATPDYATGGSLGTSSSESCIDSAFVNVGALNREWLATGRVDWNISDKHKVFFRVSDDQGEQPSFVSLINPTWNQISNQPSWTGQLNDTYMFSPNVANQFILGALYYSGIFKPANLQAALASSPTEFDQAASGGTNSVAGVGQPTFFTASTTLGSPWIDFPGGSNTTQYQFLDDLSWLKGNHSFKFGFDFLRYDLTDISLQTNAYGGDFIFGGISDEMGGSLPGPVGSFFTQTFPRYANIYSAVYNIGLYAQDEWRVKPNLALDFGLRVDRNGDPLCNENCYTRYLGGFPDTAATLDTPYNATISAGHGGFVPQMETAIVQPRGGFNLDLRGDGKTVIRGGVGLFSDNFPGLILQQTYLSFPNRYSAGIPTGTIGTGPGSAKAIAASSAGAVLNGFSQGQTFNEISATLAAQGAPFIPPNYVTTPNEFHSPRYVEYSLQLQRQITRADALILSYAGNHGFDLYIANPHLNQNIGTTPYGSLGNGTFGGLPTVSPDPRFAGVTTFSNNAISNYNGFSVQFKHVDRGGLTADIAYTLSHALDDISNGGNPQLPYNGNTAVSFQITPGLPSTLMYSNSDYDIRHNFVLDLVYAEPYRFTNRIVNSLGAGWTVSGKSYWRSGEPFSVLNTDAEAALSSNATAAATSTVLADVLNNHFSHDCTSYANPCFQQPGIFNGAGPQDAGPGVVVQTNFGNVPRNAFYGPHYADVDTALYKNLYKRETMVFQIGAQAYNTLNHVNFGQPANNASNLTTLGHISTDINAPTSPYGSSQEPTVSGRVVVVQGRFVF